MRVSIIAAIAKNRVLGNEGNIPWRLPADLKYFKKLTLGHHILMGRKTYESIGRPLPGRVSIVITRKEAYDAPGCYVANSIKNALKLAKEDDEIFIIGGAQVYKQSLALADRIYLTRIKKEVVGDAYFPEFDEERWLLVSRENHTSDENNPYPFSFYIYDRQQ